MNFEWVQFFSQLLWLFFSPFSAEYDGSLWKMSRLLKLMITFHFLPLSHLKILFGYRCIIDGSILSYFPVIIWIFSSFTPYYLNLATLTYFSTARVPQALEEQAVALPLTHIPLKRIIYIAQVWDQSNLGGTIEYTNLRSDISLAEGRRTVSAAERDRE